MNELDSLSPHIEAERLARRHSMTQSPDSLVVVDNWLEELSLCVEYWRDPSSKRAALYGELFLPVARIGHRKTTDATKDFRGESRWLFDEKIKLASGEPIEFRAS